MPIKYHIFLTHEEQQDLKSIILNKKTAQHKRTHAQIILAVDENGAALSEDEAAKVCVTSTNTIRRVRKRCVEESLDVAVESKFSRKGRKRSLDGEQQAHLVALACSEPPEGRSKWTLQLLADKLIELEVVETVSDSTLCRELKKTN